MLKKRQSLSLREVWWPWWEALRAVWWPFFLARLGLLLWAAALAVMVGSVDDYGKKTQAGWPPMDSWGIWWEKVLWIPWLHYDVHHYLAIATEGLARHPEGSIFYPLHPLSIWAATQVVGYPPAAAMLVNLVAHLGLVVVLYRYAGEDSPRVGQWTIGTLLTFPLAFILAIPYSEAPFLLFTVLAFWAARRRNWSLAGISGFLAAALRIPGLFLLPALALEWFLWALRERRRRAWLSGLWLGLIPLSPYVYAFYLSSQGIVTTWDPFRWIAEIERRFWHSAFVMPWTTLEIIVRQISQGLDGPFWINLLGASVLTLLALLSLDRRRPGPSLYTLLIVGASWSKVVLPPGICPIESFPRHLMVIFPIYLLLGRVLARWPLARPAWLGLSLPLLLFHSALFIRNAWIP